MNSKAVYKYLINHAEPESRDLKIPTNLNLTKALVIPVFAETADFVIRILTNWPDDKNLLVILVVNRPESSPHDQLSAALKSLESIERNLPKILSTAPGATWRKATNAQPIFLVIDRCTSLPIPAHQGVGLARKIGCDIALKLAHAGALSSHWVYTTDADAHLPPTYFDVELPICAAVIYPYGYRQTECKLFLATQIYDARMRHYRDQLYLAGSPYAFNPTGSLLALSLKHYAQVRGFPKLSGGEDFYLLNKLQKVGQVIQLDRPQIELESRVSNRVPFGTGPAVGKLLTTEDPSLESIFYHPDCFTTFARGLSCMESVHPQEWPQSPTMPEPFLKALQTQNLRTAQTHLSPLFETWHENPSSDLLKQTYIKNLHVWFDAFRTLKVIHYLRDQYFGCINYRDWQKLTNT